MATWTEQSRNSAAFTNVAKSDVTTFGALPLSTIEAETFDGIFRGKAIDDWSFDDPISNTAWSNATRN